MVGKTINQPPVITSVKKVVKTIPKWVDDDIVLICFNHIKAILGVVGVAIPRWVLVSVSREEGV